MTETLSRPQGEHASSESARPTPADDPRMDPRLRAVLREYGLGDFAAAPAVTRSADEDLFIAGVRESHEGFSGLYEVLPNDLPGDVDVPFEVEHVASPEGHDIVLRIYRPRGVSGPLPGILYIHGGGMVILDAFAKVHHRWHQDLAAQGAVVVAVDFRNGYSAAGLNPFPSGLDDCVAALRWIHEHRSTLGITGLVVQGESGGANLTLATALRAKREGILDAISGVYASVPYISGAYGTWPEERKRRELPSLVENDGYFLNCAAMDLLVAAYDPAGANCEDPLCWPYFATVDDVAGLPPHVIVVNELDPLRDEGIAYFRTLLEAGVSVVGRTNLGLVHAAELIFRQTLPDLYFSAVADIKHFADAVTARP